jgi:hypothetical protein
MSVARMSARARRQLQISMNIRVQNLLTSTKTIRGDTDGEKALIYTVTAIGYHHDPDNELGTASSLLKAGNAHSVTSKSITKES